MSTTDKVIRVSILALLFMSAVFAANQNVVASWVGSLRGLLGPLGNAPLYVGVRDLERPFNARDAVVDVISGNRTTRLDSILMTGTYTAGTAQLAPRTEIYLHVHSSGHAVRCYDEWYHVTVDQNQPVMRLRPGLGTGDAPMPIGRIDEEYYGRMFGIIVGGVEYWQITPTFLLQQRDAPFYDIWKFDLQNPDGVTIRTTTGVAPARGAPDSAAADFTARSSRFSLKLSVDLFDVSRTYGHPMLFLGPPPAYDWQVGYLVIWVSFNNTGINAGYLTANGWTLLDQNLTPGYMSFFRVLSPILGTVTTVGSATFEIPVDTGSLPSGTGISVRVWIADLQVPADVARGVSDAAPTPYGGVAEYGIAQTIFANGFQVSSNKPTGQLVWAAFKTA